MTEHSSHGLTAFLILFLLVATLAKPIAMSIEWWAERHASTGFVKVEAEQRP